MPPTAPTPEDLLPLQPAAFQILVALADSDRHGYGIMRDVAERTDGTLTLNPGTLYTTIRRLLDQGLIVERDERPAPYQWLCAFPERCKKFRVMRVGHGHDTHPWHLHRRFHFFVPLLALASGEELRHRVDSW